jgi:uridine kinase
MTGRPSASYLVGVAGGSASGKTTFATALAESLGGEMTIEVIGMDRYFYRGAPGGPTFTSPSTGEMLPDNNHPNSADNARLVADLSRLRAGADHPDVILVEGLMALAIPEIRELLDLKLFVELDADERALRRLLRDMGGGRGNPDPAFISRYYRECARVGHTRYVEPSRVHADLILRGDGDLPKLAAMVRAIIRDGRNGDG